MGKSADQMTQNWVKAMQSGATSERYKQGISNFGGNPMALAATPEAEARYINGVQNSVNSGKRSAALNRANPATWKANAMGVGASALSTGATKAQSKVAAHFQRWAPIYAQMSAAAKALPKGDWRGRVEAAINVAIAAKGS